MFRAKTIKNVSPPEAHHSDPSASQWEACLTSAAATSTFERDPALALIALSIDIGLVQLAHGLHHLKRDVWHKKSSLWSSGLMKPKSLHTHTHTRTHTHTLKLI